MIICFMANLITEKPYRNWSSQVWVERKKILKEQQNYSSNHLAKFFLAFQIFFITEMEKKTNAYAMDQN